MGCLIANRSGARPTKGPTTKMRSLLGVVFFFDYTQTLTMHAHSTHINACTQTLLEIDGATKNTLLSMETSPTTESINAVKSYKIRSYRESYPGPEVLLRFL